MSKALFVEIARSIAVVARSNNSEHRADHIERADELVKEHMPSGSGFDIGTEIDWNKTKENRIVFITGFHHMDQNGFYDGWSHHTVVVTPSLAWGFDIKVTGRNRNDIKEYISEVYSTALEKLIAD